MVSSEVTRCLRIRRRLGPTAAFAASMAPDGPARTLPEAPGRLAGTGACPGRPATSHPDTPITISLVGRSTNQDRAERTRNHETRKRPDDFMVSCLRG